ncbi:hypothetical protein L2E82_53798 [Cichorium intybus]|nr:hypothetical protein L2E82_53798 [Cichorium intybus]
MEHDTVQDPIQNKEAALIDGGNENTLNNCSDALKILLTKSNPIKEKLEFVENGREEYLNERMEASNFTPHIAISQVSKRITRSQTRRSTMQDELSSTKSSENQKKEDYSVSSGISTRIDEIGEVCGFTNSKEKNPRSLRAKGKNGKSGVLKLSQ